MSDTYTVERSTSIDAPPERVYAHIVDFQKWGAWSPWDEMDPDMDKKYSGPDAGPGLTGPAASPGLAKVRHYPGRALNDPLLVLAWPRSDLALTELSQPTILIGARAGRTWACPSLPLGLAHPYTRLLDGV